MSEPTRQERIDEALAVLGRMTPAGLAVDRDELFFRAGEASARGELAAAPSSRRRFVWPAIAATLALVAVGLGYSLVTQQPETKVVYVERPSTPTNAPAAVIEAVGPFLPQNGGAPDARLASRQSRSELRRRRANEMIHPQDWGALSDAFAQQLELQLEQSVAARGEDVLRNEFPRGDVRTYLELREAMRAM